MEAQASLPEPAIEPLTPEWFAARKTGIGGSDAPGICGVSEWKSPFSVYQNKVSATVGQSTSIPAMWGNLLEEAVRRRYEVKTGRVVAKGVTLLRHSDAPHLLANTDGTITHSDRKTTGTYEGKTTASWNAGKWSDHPPLDYVVQAQHYMLVQGHEWCGMACFVGTTSDLVIYDVERDDRFLKRYMVLAREFWDRVENRDPPPVDPSGATRRALDVLYPKSIKTRAVRLDWDHQHMADDLLDLRLELNALGKRKDGIETVLRGALKDAQYGLLPDGRALSRTNALRIVKRLPKGLAP